MKSVIKAVLPWLSEKKDTKFDGVYDFESDGLYFDVLSVDDLTCRLTKGVNRYSGEVVIPDEVDYDGKTFKVTELGNAFYDNDKIVGLTLPSSIIDMRKMAFIMCYNLSKLVIADGKDTIFISRDMFNHCPLVSLYIGRNIEWEVNCGNDSPFYRKRNLKTLHIGGYATGIPDNCFSRCTSLSSVEIDDGVLTIGSNAFAGCTSLRKIVVKAPAPPSIKPDTFASENYTDVKLTVPKASLQAYKNAEGWKNFRNIGGETI